VANELLVELLLMAEELVETVFVPLFVPLSVRLDEIFALELVLPLVVLIDRLKIELTV